MLAELFQAAGPLLFSLLFFFYLSQNVYFPVNYLLANSVTSQKYVYNRWKTKKRFSWRSHTNFYSNCHGWEGHQHTLLHIKWVISWSLAMWCFFNEAICGWLIVLTTFFRSSISRTMRDFFVCLLICIHICSVVRQKLTNDGIFIDIYLV